MNTETLAREPAVGDRLTAGWTIERILLRGADGDAFLVRVDEETHAVCFALAPDAPDPTLDPEASRHWGTERRVVRDDHFGRLVVDEVTSGEFVADRLATGRAMTPAALEELRRKVEDAHASGRPHGRLRPSLMIESRDGLACAGWGIADGDTSDLVALDLADLNGLSSSGGSAEAGAGEAPGLPGVETGSDDTAPSLHAAVVSEHLPTLRRALASAELRSHEISDDELARARDALGRLEKKVSEALQAAEHRLATGDPLGAVASCREAIRHGAESECEVLLRRARRQAKNLVVGGGRARFYWTAGAVALAVLAVIAVGAWLVAGSGDDVGVFAERIAELENEQGVRAAVKRLVSLKAGGDETPELDGLLEASTARLLESERSGLLELRRVTVAQGGRPVEGDEASAEAITELEASLAELDHPGLETRIQRALARVDRAASLYRARTELSAAQAESAVMGMLAEDPTFLAPLGGGE